MELNVPTSGSVSHESPAVSQLHDDTKVPISEIKAKLHDKIMELNQKRLKTPSEVPFGNTTDDMKEQSYKEVEDELLHPEENQTEQDEEFKNFFGDSYPGSEAFAAPVEDNEMLGGSGDFGGGDFGGGDLGGDLGGGIDNNAMGFSDEDMSALNDTANNAFDDFTAEDGAETASDVNNISAEEPGGEEVDTDTVTDNTDETPAEEPA
jgi:hypothetical protein